MPIDLWNCGSHDYMTFNEPGKMRRSSLCKVSSGPPLPPSLSFRRLVTVDSGYYARASNSHLALDGTVRDAS